MTGIGVLIVLTLICGFYVAWNIGANDVANAMGTSVGSGALTLRRAVILAAVFEFAGAYIVGSNVSNTVRRKIFDPAEITRLHGSTETIVTIEVLAKESQRQFLAKNDFFAGQSDQKITGNLLGNDFSLSGEELTVKTSTLSQTQGKLTVNADGSFEYTPKSGFSGEDSFDYEACNTDGSIEKATVVLTIVATTEDHIDPIASQDNFVTLGNSTVTGDLFSNDLKPTDWNINTSPDLKPQNGTVEIGRDGKFTYTPDQDFVGTDSFTYSLSNPRASNVLACGMIAALLAAGTWLLIATWMSWPVSTTHSIVGAVVGFGFVALGYGGIAWGSVGMISVGWVVSPLISGAISYLLFSAILKMVFHKRDPVRAAKKLTPYLVAAVLAVLSGVTTFKGLKPLWKKMGIDIDIFGAEDKTFLYSVFGITALISMLGYFVSKAFLKNFGDDGESADSSNPLLDAEVSRSLHKAQMHLKRVRSSSTDESIQIEATRLLDEVERVSKTVREKITTNTDSPELRKVEKIFVLLQILTACLVAFAHGSNDVANAIGPLSAAYQALQEGVVSAKSSTPGWALLLGGVGIVLGLATWGWRVIQTVGKKITELTPSRGFCAEFGAAITILAASTLPIGLPISTTHTLVGAVLGVGLARGINALNLKTMRDIVAGWAITIPAGAGLSVLFYLIMKAIFIDTGWVA